MESYMLMFIVQNKNKTPLSVVIQLLLLIRNNKTHFQLTIWYKFSTAVCETTQAWQVKR